MTKSEFRKRMIIVGHYARVLLVGLKYTIIGTLTTALIAASIAGFCLVSSDGGYLAVFDFIVSCFALIIAIASMYFLGIPKRGNCRGGKYE